MKKKAVQIIVFPIFFMFIIACGGNQSESAKEQSTAKTSESSYDGTDLKITVIDFNKDNQKTNCELLNGLNKDIKSISGRLFFFDKDGNEITFATGASKSSPFQQVSNPSIVLAKSKKKISFSNKIDPLTEKIEVRLESAETTDGEKITFN